MEGGQSWCPGSGWLDRVTMTWVVLGPSPSRLDLVLLFFVCGFWVAHLCGDESAQTPDWVLNLNWNEFTMTFWKFCVNGWDAWSTQYKSKVSFPMNTINSFYTNNKCHSSLVLKQTLSSTRLSANNKPVASLFILLKYVWPIGFHTRFHPIIVVDLLTNLSSSPFFGRERAL